MRIVLRPVHGGVWPRERREQRSAPFRSTWAATKALLLTEVRLVQLESDSDDVVVQLCVPPGAIYADGTDLKARTGSPEYPGVIVSFESRRGPMSVPCDAFPTWRDNVRAVALGLKDLRRIDRYGITVDGEQYRGWLALPAAAGTSGGPTSVATAQEFLEQLVGEHDGRSPWATHVRAAIHEAHPDHGGSAELLEHVIAARELLAGAGLL